MRNPGALLYTGIVLLAVGTMGHERTEAADSKRIADTVAKEPVPIQQGSPLSLRTPVVRPPAIPNLQSWTIETVRPRGGVFSVAPSPDGKLVALGGLDGVVRIFDLKTGKFVKALVGHNYYIYGLAWSPDSSALATSGGYDANVKIWDVQAGHTLRAIPHPAYTAAIAWSPKGDQLFVTGGSSGTALLWDVTSSKKKEVAKVEFGTAAFAVAWSPDGKTIAAGISNRSVLLLNATDFTKSVSVGNIGDGQGLAWLANSEGVIPTSPKETRVWHTDTTKEGRSLATPSASVAVSPDGKTIATVYAGNIELWDAATGKSTRKFPSSATWVYWSGDGSALVAANAGNIDVFEAEDGKKRCTIDLLGTSPSVAYSPAGKLLIVGRGSAKITCIDTTTGKTLGTLEDGKAVFSAVAASPSGKQVAVGGSDGVVRLFEVNGGKLLHKLTGHKAGVMAVSWADSGAYFATASTDKTVRIWNVAKGAEERVVEDNTDAVYSTAWGPLLASGGKAHLVVLSSLMMGKPAKTVDAGHDILSMTWSPDRKALAVGTNRAEIHLINTAKGTIAQTLGQTGGNQIVSLAFAPQGNLLACGYSGHAAQIWNLQTAKVAHDIRPFAPVQTVAWTPDGKVFLTSTADRCARAWDPGTGTLLGTLLVSPGHGETVISAEGFYRAGNEDETLIFVAQTGIGQLTLTPEEFATRYKWKNQSTKARFPGP